MFTSTLSIKIERTVLRRPHLTKRFATESRLSLTNDAAVRDADDEVGVAPAPADHRHLGGRVGVLEVGDEQPQLRPLPGVHDAAKLWRDVLHHDPRG